MPDAAVEVVDAGLLSVDSGSAEVDAGSLVPVAPLGFSIDAVGLTVDGGAASLPGEVDPLREVWVRIPLLVDYRLRVLDDTERVVPSDDQAAEADGGIDYRVHFVEPLKTGHTYSLLIDAELGAVVHDARGRPMSDLELKWSIGGPRQVDPRAPGKRRKKH